MKCHFLSLQTNLLYQLSILSFIGFLHPIEKLSFGVILKAKKINSTSGALRHTLHFSIIWKNDKILKD